jgi:hypothetical protein
MSLSVKAASTLVKTCAAAVTLGVALAPSNALAVTTWNWSFATEFADQFGSGTFTTADVVPTAGTTYEITGVSGTYNRGGTAYTITGLSISGLYANKFQWSGTSSSSILADFDQRIAFNHSYNPFQVIQLLQSAGGGYRPILISSTDFPGDDGRITSSSLAPNSPPSTAAPGPLPLLGAAAAFQASRRLRRRLNGSLPAA